MNAILDIAIGLIFVYIILSLLASQIQELIAAALQWRANHLKYYIQALLSGKSGVKPQEISDAEGLVKQLYDNPLIKTLNFESRGWPAELVRKFTGSGPSYIQGTTFARALLAEIQTLDRAEDTTLDLEKFKNGLKNSVLPKNLKIVIEEIVARAEEEIDDASVKLKKIEEGVEDWFNQAMERVSGVYRRNARGFAIFLGVLIAILLNVDTLYIVKVLNADQAVRSALVASADALNTQCLEENESGKLDCFKQTDAQFFEAARISTLIGWCDTRKECKFPSKFGEWQGYPGWILTGLALSMGASFWFDLLGKVVNVRNAGRIPDESTDTESR